MTEKKLDLTLCSVSYHSRACLVLNRSLVARCQGDAEVEWLVVENSAPGSGEEACSGTADPSPPFTVLAGVSHPQVGEARASYHHAAALNKALPVIATRYALFLDPDFFIVQASWMDEVLTHMRDRRLSFFGAPYFPARAIKYRYFPCGTCLFVDLERVPKEELDFTPEIGETAAGPIGPGRRLLAWGGTRRPMREREDVSCGGMLRAVMSRALQPRSRDTGYKIYRAFSRHPGHRSECLVPGWENPLFAPSPEWKARWLGNILRWTMPEAWSPYPKQKDYAGDARFRDWGLPDVADRGWEEYFWRGEPFGFHVRGLFQGLHQVGSGELAEVVGVFPGDRGRRRGGDSAGKGAEDV